MFTDQGLRLATAETLPGGGGAGVAGARGALGAASVTLALDPSGTQAGIRRLFADIGAGKNVALNINIDTAYLSATFGATMEIQLVSLPINATKLADTATIGKILSILATLTIATDRATASTAATGVLTAHGLPVGTPVYLTGTTTTTGVVDNTIYYLIPDTVDSVKFATSLANAIAGTAIDLATGDGVAIINFIPTVHGSTGSLPLYNAGSPTNQGPLRAGTRLQVPLRAISTLAPKGQATPSGFIQPLGAGPTSGLIGANAQHFYYVRYIFSNAITAGAVTIDLVENAGNGLQVYAPSAYEVIG